MKIIVDTNIVFSALLNSNSKIGKILLHSRSPFQFYTCNYLQIEIDRHWNRILKITRLSEKTLSELRILVIQNITFIDERLLPQDILLQTENLLNLIDPNDTPFVALTTHLKGKLWTGDMQLYNGLKAKNFEDILTTTELILLFNS